MPQYRECPICFDLDAYSESSRSKWGLSFDVDSTERRHLKLESSKLNLGAKSCAYCSIIMAGLDIMGQKLTFFDLSKPFQIDLYKRPNCPLRVEVRSFQEEDGDSICEEPSALRSLSRWTALRKNTKRPRPQGHQFERQKDLQFEYYTLPDQSSTPSSNLKLGNFGVAEEVQPKIAVESCVEIIQKWVKNCCESHRICSTQEDSLPFVPTRLLELSGEQGESIRLVETMNTVEVTEPYATLSHCWGDAQFIQTNRETYWKHRKGIEICDLPKTFADVVTILRKLCIRYVWIDSLCIIQQDEVDWREQAAQMAKVYSKGWVNIAATAAEDSSKGCLNTRSLKHGQISDLSALPINVSHRSYENKMVYIRPSFHSVHQRFNIRMRDRHSDPADHKITSLLSRAWVFQERQLAPRTIHFHPTELIMECKFELRCECTVLEKIYETSRSKLAGINSLDKHQILDRWLGLINEYSKLIITQNTDRLAALTGIAKVFQDRLESHYLAGIWLDDLARGLLWNVAKPLLFEEGYNQNVYRLTSELKFAPSWSWASLVSDGKNTPINFLVLYEDSFKVHEHFEYINTNIPKMAIDSLKDLGSQYLIVQGLTITARLFHGYDKNDRTLNDTTLELLLGHQNIHLGFALDHTFSHSTVRDGDVVYCLLIGTSNKSGSRFGQRNHWLHILVCKPYHNSGVYERLGICVGQSSRKILKGTREKLMKLV